MRIPFKNRSDPDDLLNGQLIGQRTPEKIFIIPEKIGQGKEIAKRAITPGYRVASTLRRPSADRRSTPTWSST